MGRLDVEPAIKQDDVASYRDQSESWTVVMRQLALPNPFDLYKRTADVASWAGRRSGCHGSAGVGSASRMEKGLR